MSKRCQVRHFPSQKNNRPSRSIAARSTAISCHGAFGKPAASAEGGRSADMDRLYALGIDAYQVAREVAARRGLFDINGTTGRLKVSMGAGPARFERMASPAVYQGGIAAPLPGAQ